MRNMGICAAVKKYLQDNGAKKYSELCAGMPQYSPVSLSGALSTLIRDRSITYFGGKRNGAYKIYQRATESPTGPKKYIPEQRPLKNSGLLHGWQLCMRAPFDPALDVVRLLR